MWNVCVICKFFDSLQTNADGGKFEKNDPEAWRSSSIYVLNLPPNGPVEKSYVEPEEKTRDSRDDMSGPSEGRVTK